MLANTGDSAIEKGRGCWASSWFIAFWPAPYLLGERLLVTAAASMRVVGHFHPTAAFVCLGSCETYAPRLGKSRRMGALGTVPAWGGNGDSPGIVLFLWGLGPAWCVAQSQGNLAVSISAALAGSFFSPAWAVNHTGVVRAVRSWWPCDVACTWELWLRIDPQVGHP